jgi:hypothetical protein
LLRAGIAAGKSRNRPIRCPIRQSRISDGKALLPSCMIENPGSAAILIALVALLLGSGAGVSFLLGRRSGRAALSQQPDDERQLPEHVVREIIRCLELGDYVARDAETLTNIVAVQPASVSRPLATAMQQLIKTARSLVGRLNRMGAAARVARPAGAARHVSLAAAESDVESPASAPNRIHLDSAATAPLIAKDSSAAPAQSGTVDARRFPRSVFRGTAWATIYPQHPARGREPQRCEVMTRDLSCGGIGIAHTEPLFPKQILVLDAVGKLLVSEVRWCRRVDENLYVAGCRLVKTGG